GDEFAALHADMYRWCRQEWGYLLPDGVADRARLRHICRRTLAFENRFMDEYRRWVLEEVQHGDAEAQRAARLMLGRVPLADTALPGALGAHRRDAGASAPPGREAGV